MSMIWIAMLALAVAPSEQPAALAAAAIAAASQEIVPKSVDRARQDNILAQVGRNQQGMAGFGQGQQGGAPANDDYGPDLVDLIQKTISKDIWDVNNGPASIFYWRQGRALIIAAPEEVHEQIQDVLEQLERANR